MEVTNWEDLHITSNYEKHVRYELRKIVANEDQSVLDAITTIKEYIKTVLPSQFAMFHGRTKYLLREIEDKFPYCLLDDDVRLWLGLLSLAPYAPSLRRGLRVHVDKEPRKLHALPLHQYIELKANAKAICKGAVPGGAGGIASEFIDTKLLDTDNNLVWLLLVGNVIHGYAVADEDRNGFDSYTTLRVHVMCTDRGNGIKLFESVIEYAMGSANGVEIDPLDDDLKRLYQKWGEKFGLIFDTTNGRTLYAKTNENESDPDSESDSE